MHYLIYCDESQDKGRFYSDFYGGALLEAKKREAVELQLEAAKGNVLKGELKWTKISEYNVDHYIRFVDVVFDLVRDGSIKIRIMFTQNLNTTDHVKHEKDAKFFKLYYQFIKHAFGLRFCNALSADPVSISVFLDNAPDTSIKLALFKGHLSNLTDFPVFRRYKVRIELDAIMEVKSQESIILQAVDVVLGAMQFRLNEMHRAIPEGKKRRGARTKAKERVYKRINARIREIYPNFNIGVSTGQHEGRHVRWTHPYRHWCFVARGSRKDLRRCKRYRLRAP